MPVRLRDIAEKAGVSVTTVSHVLTGYSKSGIKRATCEQVLKVADELGYQPNAVARSLKSQRTNTIGFYTGYGFRDASDPFLGTIYTGIQHGCEEFGLDFLIHCNAKDTSPRDIRMALGDGRIDGLIVHAPPGDAVLDLIKRTGLPAIAIADEHEMLPSVVADDRLGMRLLINYLWQKGHRRIAYLDTHLNLTSIKARVSMFERLILERGGSPIVTPLPWTNPEIWLLGLRDNPDRPTAVCCWHDNGAYYIIKSCIESGIAVPDELAVAGFDGLVETRLPARQLTTISVPWEQLAREAVKMLVAQIQNQMVPTLTQFPVSLLAGDTA
jgi:LacI family transcriptional regulator